jgi:hypothetical protein
VKEVEVEEEKEEEEEEEEEEVGEEGTVGISLVFRTCCSLHNSCNSCFNNCNLLSACI